MSLTSPGRLLGGRRVAEPSTGLVHLDGPAVIGNVTLCGITDWLGRPAGDGAPTESPVTCPGCLGVVDHVLRVARASSRRRQRTEQTK